MARGHLKSWAIALVLVGLGPWKSQKPLWPAWINRERIRRYMRVFTLASTSENDAAAIAGRARRLFFAGERT